MNITTTNLKIGCPRDLFMRKNIKFRGGAMIDLSHLCDLSVGCFAGTQLSRSAGDASCGILTFNSLS